MKNGVEGTIPIKKHWANVVQAIGLLYESGRIKDVNASMALNASVAAIDLFLRQVTQGDNGQVVREEAADPGVNSK